MTREQRDAFNEQVRLGQSAMEFHNSHAFRKVLEHLRDRYYREWSDSGEEKGGGMVKREAQFARFSALRDITSTLNQLVNDGNKARQFLKKLRMED